MLKILKKRYITSEHYITTLTTHNIKELIDNILHTSDPIDIQSINQIQNSTLQDMVLYAYNFVDSDLETNKISIENSNYLYDKLNSIKHYLIRKNEWSNKKNEQYAINLQINRIREKYTKYNL